MISRKFNNFPYKVTLLISGIQDEIQIKFKSEKSKF
jgi:hypothetical protein